MKNFAITVCLLAASTFTNASIISFGASDITSYESQPGSGTAGTTFSAGGINIAGNAWFDVSLTVAGIALDDILTFNFSTSDLGEIHGIGFDNDDTWNNGGLFFQLGGTQTFGNQTYRLNLVEGIEYTFEIDLSMFDLSVFDRLVFINDEDRSGQTANSTFSEIQFSQPAEISAPSVVALLMLSFVGLFRRTR